MIPNKLALTRRHLEPELLDSLPHDDPGAVRSRADLRLINRLMGNYRWIEQQVHHLQPKSVLEIGAGCGALAVRLHRRAPRIAYAGVDLAPRPQNLPNSYQWHQIDLFKTDYAKVDLVIANLFLHHFEGPSLRAIGQHLRACCQHLIINEPARRPLHLHQGRLLNLLGIHPITRHDMAISIRAGFLGDELACELGLSDEEWMLNQTSSWLGGYRLTASRIVPTC